MATSKRTRVLICSLIAGTTAALAVAPAWAESHAQDRLAEQLDPLDGGSRNGGPAVTTDIDGVTLHGVSRRVGKLVARAQSVHVRPHEGKLHVDVIGFEARPAPPESATSKAPTATQPPGPNRAEPDRLAEVRRVLDQLRGTPTALRVYGDAELPLPSGLTARISDPEVDLSATGELDARFVAEVDAGEEHILVAETAVSSHVDELNSATLTASGRRPDLGTWTAGGHLQAHAAHLVIDGEGSKRAIVDVEAEPGRTLIRPRAIHAELRQFPLAVVTDLDLPASPMQRLGVVLDDADADGRLELTRTESRISVALDSVRLRGVALDSPHLSRERLTLDELGLDGQISWASPDASGQVVVSHGDAQVSLEGQGNREHMAIHAALAPISCQALLESAPEGFMPALDGMQLDGEIDGELELAFEFAEVLAHGESEQRAGTELPPPGNLNLEFAFLDRCAVEHDAPGVDLDALAGAYRHRFVAADGSRHDRVLAHGGEGFAPLDSIPKLAMAFVILEDVRYWRHDGFDREQMERAFWHNMGQSRFSRGASTISQQTARNLWLGGDRSVGRKLQEAMLTSRLERELGKRRILEVYLNVIELGPNVHGVGGAAEYHFGKRPQDLTLLESLHVASLAPAPVTYSRRWENGTVDAAWMEHLHEQVRRLQLHGWISRELAHSALRERLALLDHTGGKPA